MKIFVSYCTKDKDFEWSTLANNSEKSFFISKSKNFLLLALGAECEWGQNLNFIVKALENFESVTSSSHKPP